MNDCFLGKHIRNTKLGILLRNTKLNDLINKIKYC